MTSDIEKALEGRTCINGEEFTLKPDGLHIQGGLNLTMSNIRFSMEQDVCYRPDVANMLDSWIVDMNTGVKYLQCGMLQGFRDAYSSVRKSMLNCLWQICNESELQTARQVIVYEIDLAVKDVRRDFDRNTCWRTDVIDLITMCLLWTKKSITCRRLANEQEARVHDDHVYEVMLRALYHITTVEDRQTFSHGETLQ